MSAPLKLVIHRLQYYGLHRYGTSRRLLRAALASVVFAVTIVALPAKAQTITTDEAIARAQQQVPGKLVAVSKEQQGEQIVYRVRILGADGVVRTVFINANR